MSVIKDINSELESLRSRIDRGLYKNGEEVIGWSFADFIEAKDTIDRVRYLLNGMADYEGERQMYAVVGEFDDDEDFDHPNLGIAVSKQAAEFIAKKANDLIDRWQDYKRELWDFNGDWVKANPRPEMKPRTGKLSRQDYAEIAEERRVWNEWSQRKSEAERAFKQEKMPEMDEIEQKLFPYIEKYTDSMWEGSFGPEPIKVWEEVES